MKKFIIVVLSAMMILSMVGCSEKTNNDDKTIDKLVVSFVPSKDLNIRYGEKLLTLSNCDRSISDGRCVVVAVRID